MRNRKLSHKKEYFGFLKGQKMISGKLGEEQDCYIFGFVFSDYELIVYCPWRIRHENKILVGSDDLKACKVTYRQIYDLLRNKRIVNINLYDELSTDMYLEFDGNLILELFPVSTWFEAWELREIRLEGKVITALPGGELEEI